MVDVSSSGSTGGGRQVVLTPSKVAVADTFLSLPDDGMVKDLGSLEEVLGQAANAMASTPPARLLVVDKANTAYLAVSRMLIDGWSLRLLAGELVELYKQEAYGEQGRVALGKQMRPSFMEEVRRLHKVVKKEDEEAQEKKEEDEDEEEEEAAVGPGVSVRSGDESATPVIKGLSRRASAAATLDVVTGPTQVRSSSSSIIVVVVSVAHYVRVRPCEDRIVVLLLV